MFVCQATKRWLTALPLVGLLVILGACMPNRTAAPQADPAGSCVLGLAEGTVNEDAIRAVLAAEGTFVVAQDIEPLMALWAEDSLIADAKNTPADMDDDQRWIEKDAIRHRYVRTVFPGAPSAIQPADLDILVEDKQATVIATTQVGSEIAPAGDRWTLIKQGDCWYLQSLIYNLEDIE